MVQIKKLNNSDVTVKAPPAKAHTLRSLIIGSLAKGRTIIRNPLLGDDQLNVINCMKTLGIDITREENTITIHGGNRSSRDKKLNVGDSGVGMNFLTSVCCLMEGPVVVSGSDRIRERPIGEVVDGLRQLGASISYLGKEGFPPIRVAGNGLPGGTARINGSKTSQYFSSIAISSPYAKKPVELLCMDAMTEKPYFDITLSVMKDFGVDATNENYKRITIPANQEYTQREVTIEGDYSSASFFFICAGICGSRVTVSGLNPETKQGDRKIVDILETIGCTVGRSGDCVTIQGGSLEPLDYDMQDVPDLVPPVAVTAAFAKGTSRLSNVGHLRFKESDRVSVIISELGKMGVHAYFDEGSLFVEGSGKIHGATIDPHNDHRIAMSFAIAGLAVPGVFVTDERCVAKSFPDFWERLVSFNG